MIIQTALTTRGTTETSQPTPARLTNYTANDIAKVQEVFSIFASEDFCRHLTQATTQNANEALHNTIWNFCLKAKYISSQSIRISTGIAVLCFNDTELIIYGLLSDLKLSPSYTSFRSLLSRDHTKKLHLKSTLKKNNIDRRTRRQRKMKERRERELLRAEGGHSYKSGSFGSEEMRPPKTATKTRGRYRGRGTSRGKGVKSRLIPADSSESFSDTDISTASSGGVCDICDCRQPSSQIHRTISGKASVQWVGCDLCPAGSINAVPN